MDIPGFEGTMESLNKLTIKPCSEGFEWIPCKERLPEKDGRYIVTIHSSSTFVAVEFWQNGRWSFRWNEDVTAWAELPEPYEEDKK